MGDELGRATGEAESAGCGALAWNKSPFVSLAHAAEAETRVRSKRLAWR